MENGFVIQQSNHYLLDFPVGDDAVDDPPGAVWKDFDPSPGELTETNHIAECLRAGPNPSHRLPALILDL